jgi:Mitochondrial-associated sphingomyelin phosphodiesterase
MCFLLFQFENEFESLWHRNDFYGKFSRQILNAPVEIKVFDKSAGYSEVKVRQVGARLSLRNFASSKIILMFIMAFIFGRLFFGASSLGFLTFASIVSSYLIIKALVSS